MCTTSRSNTCAGGFMSPATAPFPTSCRWRECTIFRPNWRSISSRKHRSCFAYSFTRSRRRIIDGRGENGVIEAKAMWTDNHRFLAQASSGHEIVVDGDSKTGSSPMELVLIGLCGCTGYDVASILNKKREPFTSLEVRAEAERAANPPAVYTEIRLVYRVGGNVSHKAVEDAVRLSEEKYCSVAAMLHKTAKISYAIEYV